MRKIIDSRAGGRVERCHNFAHHGSYSVASHSWGVAMLMYYLFPEDYQRLSIYCLTHDISEAWIGDIPSPTMLYAGIAERVGKFEKKLNENLGLPSETDLSPEDYQKLKACDRLEFYLWSKEQLLLGNRFAEDGIIEVERHFDENPMPKSANDFYLKIKAETLLPRQCGVMKGLANAI